MAWPSFGVEDFHGHEPAIFDHVSRQPREPLLEERILAMRDWLCFSHDDLLAAEAVAGSGGQRTMNRHVIPLTVGTPDMASLLGFGSSRWLRDVHHRTTSPGGFWDAGWNAPNSPSFICDYSVHRLLLMPLSHHDRRSEKKHHENKNRPDGHRGGLCLV